VIEASGSLNDRAGFEQAIALLFIDFELCQEAMADQAEVFVDRLGPSIGEANGSAGSLVVATGGTKAINNLAKNFAGMAAEMGDTDRELHQVVE
jgi:hypothetical protein